MYYINVNNIIWTPVKILPVECRYNFKGIYYISFDSIGHSKLKIVWKSFIM